MNENQFNSLAFRIGSKANDITDADIQRYNDEVKRRQAEVDAERERIYQARQEKIKRDNEARPAAPVVSSGIQDEDGKWENLLSSREYSIISRSKGDVQHYGFGFFKKGEAKPNLFVSGDALTNLLTMASNLQIEIKRRQ